MAWWQVHRGPLSELEFSSKTRPGVAPFGDRWLQCASAVMARTLLVLNGIGSWFTLPPKSCNGWNKTKSEENKNKLIQFGAGGLPGFQHNSKKNKQLLGCQTNFLGGTNLFYSLDAFTLLLASSTSAMSTHRCASIGGPALSSYELVLSKHGCGMCCFCAGPFWRFCEFPWLGWFVVCWC